MKKINPSNNPLKWNWVAIITWAVLCFIGWQIGKFFASLTLELFN